MASSTDLRARSERRIKKKTPLIHEVIRTSLDPGGGSIQCRVELALRESGQVAKAAAAKLSISGPEFSRWIRRKKRPPVLADKDVAEKLAPFLDVHPSWLLTGSLVEFCPSFLKGLKEVIDALTAVAAVQLYGAMTIKCCSPAFLDALREVRLGDVEVARLPFPGPITEACKPAWLELMNQIPFLPQEMRMALTYQWTMIGQMSTDPDKLLREPYANVVIIACNQAIEWASQEIKNASSTHMALAKRIRAVNPSRHHIVTPSDAWFYFMRLGIPRPSVLEPVHTAENVQPAECPATVPVLDSGSATPESTTGPRKSQR